MRGKRCSHLHAGHTNVLPPRIYGGHCTRCFYRLQILFASFLSQLAKLGKGAEDQVGNSSVFVAFHTRSCMARRPRHSICRHIVVCWDVRRECIHAFRPVTILSGMLNGKIVYCCRRERPVCRSESPANRPFFMIRDRFVIVPSERHIGRSLRYRYTFYHSTSRSVIATWSAGS